jgi:hypothetical protein
VIEIIMADMQYLLRPIGLVDRLNRRTLAQSKVTKAHQTPGWPLILPSRMGLMGWQKRMKS